MSEEWLKAVLKRDWTTPADAFDGRIYDVPKPKIVKEKDDTKASGKRYDIVELVDGGPQNREPAGAGMTHRNLTTRVTVRFRTTESRRRAFGYINEGTETDEYGLEPGESETHGGLLGEILRIVEKNRFDHPGSNFVDANTFNNRIGNTGRGVFNGDVEVEFRSWGNEI